MNEEYTCDILRGQELKGTVPKAIRPSYTHRGALKRQKTDLESSMLVTVRTVTREGMKKTLLL